MNRTRVLLVALALSVLNAPLRAEEPTTSKIVAVDLFKNGLAVVKREATLGKSGVYVIDDVPAPIHGTYWIESIAPVETVVKMRDVEVPLAETTPGNLQDDLAGKKVTVHFKGDRRGPVTGIVMKFKPVKSDEGLVQPSHFLVLQTPKGRTYVESSEVAAVEAEDGGEKVTRRQPRLLLTLGKTDKDETKVAIRYLTRGIAWAPSYKIDISDPKTLTLEQSAVVKNELADLTAAEMRLISGYPSVQFAHVWSPLAPRVSWAMFSQSLSGTGGRDNNDAFGGQGQGLGLQLQGRFTPDFPSLGAIPTGEGVDLHYQSIGKRSLAEGETLALTVAKGTAEYERIVEWLVPDNRNEHGQSGGRSEGGRGEDTDDSPWDALKFKNPLAFPMTTGPALVTSGGSFNGQRASYWVNAGEEMVLSTAPHK